ncbi:MAG: hypothetical protein ACHQK9_10500 [Reyranellales bacterium]
MSGIRLWLTILTVLLPLQLPAVAVAQTTLPIREQITKVIEIIRYMPPSSQGKYRAGDLLISLVRELDPKDADEKLIDELISFLGDSTLRHIGAVCLQPLDRQEVARKAIPKLLEVLPEEDCRGVGQIQVRTGHWTSDDIRYVLTEMGVEGRDWMSGKVVCPPPKKDR